jgi:hypothetical protein
MTVLKADTQLKSYLAPLTEQTEIQDADGTLLGVFTPASQNAASNYAEVRKLFDPEEIKHRREQTRDDPGRPLDEIVKHLRSLRTRDEMDAVSRPTATMN